MQAAKNLLFTHEKPGFSGLSPKENREIPPLDYDRVYQLKKDFPQLIIAIKWRH